MKIARICIVSAGIVLMTTGVAKLISAAGSAHILQSPDPILGISFRADFLIAGSIESAIALACLLGKRIGLQAGLVAWLSTNLALYRFCVWSVGWHRPCPCLGNLTDAIHVSPQVGDNVMKAVLAYLLIGSYAILFHNWWKNRQLRVGSSKMETISPDAGGGG